MPNPSIIAVLARAFMAGEQNLGDVVRRGNEVLGRAWPWLPKVAERYLANWERRTRPRHAEVVRFLSTDGTLAEHLHKLNLAHWLMEPQAMQPVMDWPVPAIETAGALAEWLAVSVAELDWFADLKGWTGKCPEKPLRHYRYRTFAKKSGGIRLVESPKPRLKALQRRILSEILDQIPLHDAVHGFRAGRSIKSFAAPHAGQEAVLRLDLEDFFPSISGPRVQTFFRTAGYPEAVADLLGGLCTNATPRDVWRGGEDADVKAKYARTHLPQGAPTSPALANLCAYRLDVRLFGLAQAAGANFTRYADDLAFSGDATFARSALRFAAQVSMIAREEGFVVNHHKTRLMRRGVRQRLAGLVINAHANVPRADFDRLKAELNNCVEHGPRSQNLDGQRDYRAHLQGRVAFVEMINPAKAQRLRKLLEQIEWNY